MNIDVLKDKFSGCLLGLAIGDAMGWPVEGLTPFEIMRSFHAPIDGFYPSKGRNPGDYGIEGNSAIKITNALLHDKTIESDDFFKSLNESTPYNKNFPASGIFSMVVPIALVAATKKEQNVIWSFCKTIGQKNGLAKSNIVSLFAFACMLKEILESEKQLINPFELFDADRSVLAKTITECIKIETKINDEEDTERLSERLDFVRRQLMKSRELFAFIGLNGNKNDIQSALSIAIFAYMSIPDDFNCISKIVSMGGESSLHGAMVGALIGATIGEDLLPKPMKVNVKNEMKIASLASAFVEKCQPQSEEKTDVGIEDESEQQ
jgi:ADP-ribosylglycohydrolase